MDKKYSIMPYSERAAIVVNWLNEHKARDVVSLDIKGVSSFADAMIVATASSVRHGQSLADSVNELCGKEKFEFLSMEGYQSGQWILVDLNDIVVNIFQETEREVYRLESLWTDARLGVK